MLWLRIWSASCQRNTSLKRLCTPLSANKVIRRITCESLRTSSRWLVRRLQNVTPSQVDSAWPHASSFSSNSMMCSSTLSQSDLTSSTMMTSIGTLVSHLQQQVSIKRQRKASYRCKTSATSKNIVTSLGCAAVISWTRSHILRGISTSIWKPQMRVCPYWIWSPTIATKWDNSTSRRRPLMC